MQTAAIHRKQVPLCPVHHTRVHQNTHTPLERIFCTRLYPVGIKPNQKEIQLISYSFCYNRSFLLESRMMGNHHVRFGGQYRKKLFLTPIILLF
jgi:hypothetical protein